jgi:hypothetical protein
MIGPTTTVPRATDTTFSDPIWTAAGAAASGFFSACVPHAAANNATFSVQNTKTHLEFCIVSFEFRVFFIESLPVLVQFAQPRF